MGTQWGIAPFVKIYSCLLGSAHVLLRLKGNLTDLNFHSVLAFHGSAEVEFIQLREHQTHARSHHNLPNGNIPIRFKINAHWTKDWLPGTSFHLGRKWCPAPVSSKDVFEGKATVSGWGRFSIFDLSWAGEHQLALRLTPVCIFTVGKNYMTSADQGATLLGRGHELFGTIKTRKKGCQVNFSICLYIIYLKVENQQLSLHMFVFMGMLMLLVKTWLEPFHRDAEGRCLLVYIFLRWFFLRGSLLKLQLHLMEAIIESS